MKIKKLIKETGKIFVALEQKDEKVIRQSVLIIDNGYARIELVRQAINKIKSSLPKAEITILTFEDRKCSLNEFFPALNYVIPRQGLKPGKYGIALRMSGLRKNIYDFIVLFSLDITPLVVSLLFFESKILLYNEWGQWWHLRFRNCNEIFRSTYVRKKAKFGLKNALKGIGLFFVSLQRDDENAFRHSILLVDNGYAPFEQIVYTVQRIKDSLPCARISVLISGQKEEEFKKHYPDLEALTSRNSIIKKYGIARDMLRLRNNRYDYIILLSLDITPIFASFLFKASRILLNNQWHQWWSLKPRSAIEFLAMFLKFILSSIFNTAIFIYLLFSVSWIFLRKLFNILKSILLAGGHKR